MNDDLEHIKTNLFVIIALLSVIMVNTCFIGAG